MPLIDKNALISELLKLSFYPAIVKCAIEKLPVYDINKFTDEISFLKSHIDKQEAQIAGLILENNILRGGIDAEEN